MITDSIILSACHISRPSNVLFLIGDRCLCIQCITGDRCLCIKTILLQLPRSSGPLPAPGDSGLPGSLQGVFSGPHPAVSGPHPARRQQQLAELAEEGWRVPTLGGASTSRVGDAARAQPVITGAGTGVAHLPGSDRRRSPRAPPLSQGD